MAKERIEPWSAVLVANSLPLGQQGGRQSWGVTLLDCSSRAAHPSEFVFLFVCLFVFCTSVCLFVCLTPDSRIQALQLDHGPRLLSVDLKLFVAHWICSFSFWPLFESLDVLRYCLVCSLIVPLSTISLSTTAGVLSGSVSYSF